MRGLDISISVITEIELLSFPGIGKEEEADLQKFFAQAEVISLSSQVKNLAIEIRREHKLKLPDAIIAATAIHLDARLYTGDKVFQRISRLKSRLIVPKQRV